MPGPKHYEYLEKSFFCNNYPAGCILQRVCFLLASELPASFGVKAMILISIYFYFSSKILRIVFFTTYRHFANIIVVHAHIEISEVKNLLMLQKDSQNLILSVFFCSKASYNF
jgi:hypothetical protein